MNINVLHYQRYVTLKDNVALFARYKIQYFLEVNSTLGTRSNPEGTGWYDGGIEAKYSVDPSAGFWTLQSLDRWAGDLPGTNTSPSGSLSMDGPKKITALWKFDFGYLVRSWEQVLRPLPYSALSMLRSMLSSILFRSSCFGERYSQLSVNVVQAEEEFQVCLDLVVNNSIFIVDTFSILSDSNTITELQEKPHTTRVQRSPNSGQWSVGIPVDVAQSGLVHN